MKRSASTPVLILCLFVSGSLFAQLHATVNHGCSLRGDASIANPPIGHLNKDSSVTVLSKRPRAGFYHVQTRDGTKGWVAVKYLDLESADTQSTPTTITGSSSNATATGSAADADLYKMLFSVHSKAVGQPLVVNQKQVCGPEGDATNQKIQVLNDNKNRTDLAFNYVSVSWEQLKNLPADRVDDFQGAAVSVVGYLSHRINVARSESTNCHLLQPNEVDWHIYLTNSPAQGIADAIIVEATPRARPYHKWTRVMLTPLVDTDTQVRISGWLLYDLERVKVIGKQRATAWEVHPITRIEVQKNGQWVDLDSEQWMQTAKAP